MKKLLLTAPVFLFLSACAQKFTIPHESQPWLSEEFADEHDLTPYQPKEDLFTQGLQEMSTRISQSNKR